MRTEGVEALSSAVERFDRLKMRLDAGSARLDLGEALAAAGQTELAVDEVKPRQSDLRRLGPSVRPTARTPYFVRWVNEGESVPRASGVSQGENSRFWNFSPRV